MLSKENIDRIKDAQQASIKAKTLVVEQLNLIYDNKWFNIWVPKKYNGLELDLVSGIKLLEELAYQDGGLAWTITLCSGANMFVGYMPDQTAEEVFSNPKVCLGGSGRVGGRAVFDGEKFTISGVWQYATGAPHLTFFTLNATIYDGENIRLDNNGNPVVYSFIVPKDHVLIHYDWDTFGLECTASHSFSLENVTVPVDYAFELIPDKRVEDNKLFRIPFLTFAELTLLSNYFGMYKRFLDLAERYFFEKSKDDNWNKLYGKDRFRFVDELSTSFLSFKTSITLLTDQLWLDVGNEEIILDIAKQSRAIVKDLRIGMIEIYPMLGIRAAQIDEEMNVVFRNFMTATQHSLLNI